MSTQKYITLLQWVSLGHVNSNSVWTLNFNVTGIKGNVLISYVDTLALGIVLASNKLDKTLPCGAKIIISQVQDWETVHTPEDIISLYPDYLTGLGKPQAEPYHIEIDQSVQPKKSHCSLTHQQAAFKEQLAEIQTAEILKPVDHTTPLINYSVVVNNKQLD